MHRCVFIQNDGLFLCLSRSDTMDGSNLPVCVFDSSFTHFFLDPRIFFFLINRKRKAKTTKASRCEKAIASDT